MRHILITGAAGFIGSHVAERLIARGDRVVGLDDFNDYYDPAIKRENARILGATGAYQQIEGDIRDSRAVRDAFEAAPVDAVIHLAARAGVRPSVEQPALYTDVNLTGTALLLEGARARGVERFVFASSSSVYGGNTITPFREDHPVENPISPYAATKRAGELLCSTYHHLYSATGALAHLPCLRFFTVYGPRQRPEMAISKFTALLLAGQPIPMFGDGTTLRDYTFIRDIVDGVVGALDKAQGYGIYNLGGEDPVRLDALIAAIGAAVGVEPTIERLPMQPGDVTVTSADCAKARADLGYAPTISIEEGVRRYVAWHREHRA